MSLKLELVPDNVSVTLSLRDLMALMANLESWYDAWRQMQGAATDALREAREAKA